MPNPSAGGRYVADKDGKPVRDDKASTTPAAAPPVAKPAASPAADKASGAKSDPAKN